MFAVFVATQAAVKHTTQGGRVINIGSGNAERTPFAGGAVYAMSRAAPVRLARGLRVIHGGSPKTVQQYVQD
jgi:3-oxoacyl-[acyl-carrier protein] reductase